MNGKAEVGAEIRFSSEERNATAGAFSIVAISLLPIKFSSSWQLVLESLLPRFSTTNKRATKATETNIAPIDIAVVAGFTNIFCFFTLCLYTFLVHILVENR